MEGNNSSNFISDNINASTFPLVTAIKWSNLNGVDINAYFWFNWYYWYWY